MKAKLLISTVILMSLLSNMVFAIPGIPHAFRGPVTINGAPAPDGTVVSARIDGVEVESGVTSGGTFGYPWGEFYIDDPYSTRSGDTINFFVDDVDTGVSETFQNEGFTELTLSITTGTTTIPGGGGTTPTVEEEPEEIEEETVESTEESVTCEEKWVCGDWSGCINGLQTRECRDENNCGTSNNEPFLSQPCTEEEVLQQGGPTGFFSLSPIQLGIAGFVGLIIAIVLIYWSRRRKK